MAWRMPRQGPACVARMRRPQPPVTGGAGHAAGTQVTAGSALGRYISGKPNSRASQRHAQAAPKHITVQAMRRAVAERRPAERRPATLRGSPAAKRRNGLPKAGLAPNSAHQPMPAVSGPVSQA